jgi:deoxyhypusine synthase
MTLAGAMTVAKQGLIVAELIDRGIVNAIVSTGALMAHGLVEATGKAHFRANPEVSDEELYEQGYNRVYDTLEPEQNLDDVEEVMSAVLEAWDHNEVMCSYKLNHAIGAYLAKHSQGQRGSRPTKRACPSSCQRLATRSSGLTRR